MARFNGYTCDTCFKPASGNDCAFPSHEVVVSHNGSVATRFQFCSYKCMKTAIDKGCGMIVSTGNK